MPDGMTNSKESSFSDMIRVALSPSPTELQSTARQFNYPPPGGGKPFDLPCLLNIYCDSNMTHYVLLPQYWPENLKQ